MKNDPIVEEVHRIRQRMWDDAGGDFGRLIESLRATEAQHQDRVLSPEQLEQLKRQPRRPADDR